MYWTDGELQAKAVDYRAVAEGLPEVPDVAKLASACEELLALRLRIRDAITCIEAGVATFEQLNMPNTATSMQRVADALKAAVHK